MMILSGAHPCHSVPHLPCMNNINSNCQGWNVHERADGSTSRCRAIWICTKHGLHVLSRCTERFHVPLSIYGSRGGHPRHSCADAVCCFCCHARHFEYRRIKPGRHPAGHRGWRRLQVRRPVRARVGGCVCPWRHVVNAFGRQHDGCERHRIRGLSGYFHCTEHRLHVRPCPWLRPFTTLLSI
jgi:hypothetical protein